MDLIDFSEFKKEYERKKVEEVPNETSFKPKVSICVQTFQHVKYVKDCLEGLLNQKTNFDYEILLGEDNSTDGTREICIEYAKRNPDKIRLFLHHRENNLEINGSPTGRFILMNNCYSSRGKYIALCEGDDYWIDQFKLQKQVDFLDSNSEYIACFTNGKVKNEIKELEYIYKEYEKIDFDIFDVILNGAFFPTASLVFRNKFNSFPDFIFKVKSGDRALALILAEKGKFRLIDQPTVVYRRHEGGLFSSIVDDMSKRVEIDMNNILLLKSFNKYSNNSYSKTINKAISNRSYRALTRTTKELPKTRKEEFLKNLSLRDRIKWYKNNIERYLNV